MMYGQLSNCTKVICVGEIFRTNTLFPFRYSDYKVKKKIIDGDVEELANYIVVNERQITITFQ